VARERDAPDVEGRADAVPEVHDLVAGDEVGAALEAVEGDEVAEAVEVHDAVQQVAPGGRRPFRRLLRAVVDAVVQAVGLHRQLPLGQHEVEPLGADQMPPPA